MIQTKHKLPSGWKWVKLSNLITNSQSGFACGERESEGTIQLRMNNVDTRGNFVWDEYIRVPAQKETIEQYSLAVNDVVFNNTNSVELVGKSALFRGYDESIVYSNHFTRLRTIQDLLIPAWLSDWLNLQWQKGIFANICNRWIGQSAVKPDKLLSLEIPLPPLPEQKRIVKILNAQLEAVETARKAAEEQLKTAQALPAAYLREIFSSSNLKKWPKKYFGDVARIVAKQVNPTLPEYCNLPHVNGENIESGTGRITYLNTAAEEKMISGKYLFEPNSILYSKLRPYLKKVTLVNFSGLCSADMYPIEINPSYLIPEFTLLILLSEEFTQYANNESQRARMPKLNREQLFSWETPVPEIEEQQRLSKWFKFRIEKTNELMKQLEKQLNEINIIPSSLLRKAFQGEL